LIAPTQESAETGKKIQEKIKLQVKKEQEEVAPKDAMTEQLSKIYKLHSYKQLKLYRQLASGCKKSN